MRLCKALCVIDMQRKIKNNIAIFIAFIIIAAGAAFLYMVDQHNEVIERAEARHDKLIAQYQQKEINFQNAPTLQTGLELAGWYIEIQNYEKSLLYCKKCIDLGAEKNPRVGALVRYIMYDAYLNLGDKELARTNLIESLALDPEFIKYEWISDPELKDVYMRIKNTNKTNT